MRRGGTRRIHPEVPRFRKDLRAAIANVVRDTSANVHTALVARKVEQRDISDLFEASEEVADQAEIHRLGKCRELAIEPAPARYITTPGARCLVVVNRIERESPHVHVALGRANRGEHRVRNTGVIEFVLQQRAKMLIEIPAAAELDVVAKGLGTLGIADRRIETSTRFDGQMMETRFTVSGVLLVPAVPIAAAVLAAVLGTIREHAQTRFGGLIRGAG